MLTTAAEPELAPFSSFDFSGGAVVAVSGGSDSTALLLLLKDYLDRRHPDARLLAVTIDHALRPGSAAEAEAVARLCAAHGIAHRILTWSTAKPATGLSAAAREARYRLLAEAARQAGIGLVATGHTADDQAETIWMRQARSNDPDAPGLSGMAPATLYDGAVWIVRPLLGTRRQSLRDRLSRKRVGWIDDPTNADRRFERPRLRVGVGNDDARIAETLATAGQAARRREDLAVRAAHLIATHADRPAPGLVRLDPAFAGTDDRAAAIHVLRVLLAVTGGTTFLPPKEPVEALLAKLATSRKTRATLSRCVVDARRAGVFLHRELRDLPVSNASAGAVWDGRYRITFDDDGNELVIAPRGTEAAGAKASGSGDVPASLVKTALAAEPAAFGEEKDLNVPREVEKSVFEPVMAPWRLFLPSFDLPLASAVARLIGAPPIPDPPFSGPIDGGTWFNA